ncbi:MAG TPA: hypothetical protein VFN41_12240, partial [Candidatus Limnocylindrales bacterium]|nr:hypothetical protein [Candidatus Limnocylindrales bacterium]
QDSCDLLEGLGVPSAPTDLNLPSIGISEVAGSQTVTRTVTSVARSNAKVTYRARVSAPAGYKVKVSPSKITLRRGQSATFRVTVTNVSAPIGAWRFGSLTWVSHDYKVRSPIAVKGALFDAPEEVAATGTAGSVSIPVKFGYTGAYTAAAHGLVKATLTHANVKQDADQTFAPGDVATGGANLHQFTLSGAALLRVAIPPDGTEANADLDVYVVGPHGEEFSSTAGGTDEEVDIPNPANGVWKVYVHGWSTPGGNSDYDMWSWAIPATPGGGSLSIASAPTSATNATVGTVEATWSGITAGTSADWYLGAVSHSGPTGVMGLTVVNVDNRH